MQTLDLPQARSGSKFEFTLLPSGAPGASEQKFSAVYGVLHYYPRVNGEVR